MVSSRSPTRKATQYDDHVVTACNELLRYRQETPLRGCHLPNKRCSRRIFLISLLHSWHNGHGDAPPPKKIAPFSGESWPSRNTWFLAARRVHSPKGISSGSSFLAQLMVVTGGSVAEWLACWTQAQKFKSQSRRCRLTVLGDKLLTPIVPLFTKQQNWLQLS